MVVSRSPPAMLSSATALMNRMAGSPRLMMAIRWKGIPPPPGGRSGERLATPGSGHGIGQRDLPLGVDGSGQRDGPVALHIDQDGAVLVDDAAAEAGPVRLDERLHTTV